MSGMRASSPVATDQLIRYGGEFADLLVERASGSWLETADGRRILDFTSGQMCATLGHGHPAIIEAMRDAGERVVHLFSGFLSRDVTELARELMAVLPEPLARAMFLSTGGEANEAALRLAKLHHRRARGARVRRLLARHDRRRRLEHVQRRPARLRPRDARHDGVADPERLPLPDRPLPRPLRPDLPRRRPGARRRPVRRRAGGRDRGADPERRRHRAAARGLPRAAQAALRRPRHAADPRRGPDRAGARRRRCSPSSGTASCPTS